MAAQLPVVPDRPLFLQNPGAVGRRSGTGARQRGHGQEFPYHAHPMAQYVYTMRRVAKVVPPKRTILKNISLNFFPGAKIGVLGLNGSGESSLLRIMAGVDNNYDGEVVRMPGIRVGFLEQEPQLPTGKSVRESVEQALG